MIFRLPLLCALVLSASSFADDGALTAGGSPGLVSGHPSVVMQRERVVLTAGLKTVHVDCTFVFHNEGPSCTVRMGFPDLAEGAEGTDYYERLDAAKENGRTLPPWEGLIGFASWVDGKRVRTTLIRGNRGVDSWHAKTVLLKLN